MTPSNAILIALQHAPTRLGRILPPWVVFAGLLLFPACRTGAPPPESGSAAAPVRPVAEVIAARAPELMAIPGVAGVYEGETRRRAPCIRVMVVRRTRELEARLPKTLDGYPVEIEETGEIRPLGRP